MIYIFYTNSFNCVLLEEHPKADPMDVFSEYEYVFVYKLNIMLKVEEPLLFFNPTQNTASLMSAGILEYLNVYFCLVNR